MTAEEKLSLVSAIIDAGFEAGLSTSDELHGMIISVVAVIEYEGGNDDG